MGVPGLFRWVRRHAPKIIDGSPADPDDQNGLRYFDHVYLDFNGCIHGSLDGANAEGNGAEEEAIFERVELELGRLLRCVLPTLLLYVALDGVAPRSKANQQRTRRYRSSMEAEEAGKSSGFDRNAITAGTPFMSRMTLRLKDWARRTARQGGRLQGVTIVISGDDCPGEGEHKIMDAIRLRNRQHPRESHCMLGADADLLLLGLASEVQHFYVLREQYSYGAHTGIFDVLRLAALREYLTQVRFPSREPARIVKDFVALCCLSGNDFLPALAPCRLDSDGLDRVLASYEAHLTEWGGDGYLTEACLEETGGQRLVWPRWQQVLADLVLHEQESVLESMGLGLGKPPKDPVGGHPPPPDPRWDGLTCLLTNVPAGASIDELRRACQPAEGQGAVMVSEVIELEGDEEVDEATSPTNDEEADRVIPDPQLAAKETAEQASDVKPRSKGKGKGKGKRKGKGKGKHRKGSWGSGDQQYVASFETIEAAVRVLVRGPRWVQGSRITCRAHRSDSAHECPDEGTDASEIWRPLLAAGVIDAFEFWFSSKNLASDPFLRRHIRRGGPDRFVPIRVLLKFAKMKALSQNPEEVAGMLRSSENLEVRQSVSGEWEVRSVADNSRSPKETDEIVGLQQAIVAAVDSGDSRAANALLNPRYYGTQTSCGPVAAGVPSPDDLPGRASCWSQAYLRGIEWVLRYYTTGLEHPQGLCLAGGGTASWHWFYPAHYAPCCADLEAACQVHAAGTSNTREAQNHTFSEAEAPASAADRRRLAGDPDGPLSPELFLLSVLPPQSSAILSDPALQEFLGSPDSPMSSCFPRSVELRWPPGVDPSKAQDHQQLVLVPFIEEAHLCQTLRSASWTGTTRSTALEPTSFVCGAGVQDCQQGFAYQHGVSKLSKPGQTLLVIRHGPDEKLGCWVAARRFAQWQPADYRDGHQAAGVVRDPCLTEVGVQVAGKGVGDALRSNLSRSGNGGLPGGLQRVGEGFFPELILSSPLSRALQTALVTFDQCAAPIIVCPALTELKDDDTKGGQFPEGKGSCQGMTKTMLHAAVDAHPRTSGGRVDLSQIVEDNWYDPNLSFENKCKNFSEFLDWLAARKERRIAVVSHGPTLTHWLNARCDHGEYALCELECNSAASDQQPEGRRLTLTRCSDGVRQCPKTNQESGDNGSAPVDRAEAASANKPESSGSGSAPVDRAEAVSADKPEPPPESTAPPPKPDAINDDKSDPAAQSCLVA